jgi:predicted AlkP superfamily phosphohydrolase/phosphomutase
MTRAILIGLDAATPEMTRMYIDEGRCPNLKKLIETGYMAPAMPTIPTATSINWTTIATGTWPGTHGIVGMEIHLPGMPLDQTVTGFNTDLCQAEYLWNAAERGGKKACLVRYTCSWPPTVGPQSIQVDGDGKSWTQTNPSLAAPECGYTTRDHSSAIKLTLRPASGWAGLPPDEEALESELRIPAFGATGASRDATIWPNCPLKHMTPVDSGVRLHLLVRKGPSGRYETVTIARSRDLAHALDTISVGQWSKPSWEAVTSRHGTRPGGVWFRLMSLAPDGSELSLFQPEIFPADGVFTRPEALAWELSETLGPYLDEPGHVGHCFRGWCDEETYFELLDYQAQWFVKAAKQLQETHGYDLFMTQVHGLDWSMHVFTGHHGIVVDPYPDLWELMGRNYEIYDRMIGQFMALADEDTVLVVVGDHGTIDAQVDFNPTQVLVDAGLQVRKSITGSFVDGQPGLQVHSLVGEVDWTKTKAYTSHGEVWVNLQGRDPDGIVTADEYPQVVRQIIAALYDARDESTGQRKVSLALTREDALAIGLRGERVGDVVYTINPEFGGNHGELPNVHYGKSSLNSLLALNGPGVKQGYVGKTVWLTDVAPTVAWLIGAPCPRDTEGRVLFEGLVNESW